ncbi:MAG TPA: DNA methyltransferase [Pyrinomonadaceae bacterium]
MPIVSDSLIIVGDRQRELDRGHVGALRESILSKGLMHPPVVVRDGTQLRLVAGAHRLSAMRLCYEAGEVFAFNGAPVPPGQVPVTNVEDLSPADLLEAELEENIIRLEIAWQDRARALAAIHDLRHQENPTHTFQDTAKELSEKGSALAERTLRREVRNATILAANLHRPSVAKARNATEAMGILLKEEEAKVEAAYIERRKQIASAAPSDVNVLCGDMRKILPTLSPDTYDLVIADLPYGIGADTGGFRQRTIEHHNYDDSPDTARDLMQTVISDCFRICKARANLFIFGDVDLFLTFKNMASAMGWKAFRTPIIWRKSESEGLAPWGREGFRRTYEMIFWATKGQRGLLLSPTDILDVKRVSRGDRRYGAEKPIELMRLLIECSTMPGDSILDPCCGSGPVLAAARQLRRKALGIELDPGAYALSVVAAERDPVAAPDDDSLKNIA